MLTAAGSAWQYIPTFFYFSFVAVYLVGARVLLGASVGGIQKEENRLLRTISGIALGALLLLIIGMLFQPFD